MKKHKLLFIAALFALGTVTVSAQDYAFKVLANRGNNEVKSGASWLPLKTGATLKSGDEVKLGDNAYIGLVHSSGKPVEVKVAGVHKVSELEEKVPDGSSVLHKYTDFILSSNSSEAQNRLSATGAVHRDINLAGPAAIDLLLPEDEYTGIFNKNAVISWEANQEGPYIVTVKNMFEDVLEQAETSEHSYTIDLSSPKYVQENAILIEVSAKANPKQVSKRHMIKRLSPAEMEKIAAALEEIKPQIEGETALNKMVLAGFYENQHLLIDAIYAYQQALKIEPEAYQELYQDFLTRNKLK